MLLHVKTASGGSEQILASVLPVPEATVSLFPTQRAMTSSSEVTFTDYKCFGSCYGKVCLEGVSQSNGLVVIKQVTIPDRQQAIYSMAAAAASNCKESPQPWPRRF